MQGDMAEPAEIVKGCMVIKRTAMRLGGAAARVDNASGERTSECLLSAAHSRELFEKRS